MRNCGCAVHHCLHPWSGMKQSLIHSLHMSSVIHAARNNFAQHSYPISLNFINGCSNGLSCTSSTCADASFTPTQVPSSSAHRTTLVSTSSSAKCVAQHA
ncbi:hypothetical protein FIBSPDRAFT_317207 [Athelia psychrophila]|uniref:Uncharacterized protein n=1 Tax=Athelia psychrophila TaxID=1759441 RepID=A0A167WX83_9AGAM|nr:hypothetical protein FIBSPDRAFT_317207 [Fibularhizoctonia sp. CBS 109695]